MNEQAHEHRRLPHLASFRSSPLVFLTICTHERRRILANATTQSILLDTWQAAPKVSGWYVGQYVVMPDHVHLFARASVDAVSMSRWLQSWKGAVSKKMVSELGIEAPVWQKGYFDRFVRSSESYSEKWEYVRMNPVRAGLVQQSDDWPYQGTVELLVW